MTTQSEQILEDNLIKQLTSFEKYSYVQISDEKALIANLKAQLEKHNNITLSETEFTKVLNHLSKGNVFDKSKTLRDRMQLTRDNGESIYIEFIQQDHWCQNEFQVANQITMEGSYKNRYDVTILINGLPLVQIELKRRGLELKEAFNQTHRYQRHSFGASAGLFQYIQVFVISNGVNTKYFSNNHKQTFKQTFYWSDKDNKIITQLEEFAKEFLEPCHISKMICKYIVLNGTHKIPMILRPYQYYAVEAIVDRVKTTHKNGYIWHTTGSGKTLTSFKASQILVNIPKVHKVVFVVDRKDLDYQTTKEFNSFHEGSVDATNNTNNLVDQFTDSYTNKKNEAIETKLIVTTIQKLNTAISKQRFLSQMEPLQDKRIIFIFDECHRSQFGETHKRIKAFFKNAQMFGFTGTPIFVENAVKNESGKRTTKELFEECLHKYVITNAIKDENVLKFSIEYIGKYKRKDNSNNEIDIEVEAIDTKELMESSQRLEKIADYILANHGRKTHNKEFTAMFCVSSIDTLIKYYEIFKKRKAEGKHNLKIATIFSFTANEEDKDANGFIPDDLEFEDTFINRHSREKLDEFIADYNEMFNSKFSTKDSQTFYNYYNDIAKKVKNKEVDLLLVVNMFLTGFDSPMLNTLYVDKNLKYHGLIQAYSRTNRIVGEKKSQGNIVCFRNLKTVTDDAIALFSNKDAKETIIIAPYEEYVRKFSEAVSNLLQIAPTVGSINDFPSEVEELEFIRVFRELMRIINILGTFADFNWEHLAMTEQRFMDYRSKYLDLHDKVKSGTMQEKVSILDDVDFELELIHRDEVNVAYILRLLAKLKDSKTEDQEKQKKEIIDLLAGEASLRSKRELIENFINKNLPKIMDVDDIPSEWETHVSAEYKKALETLSKEENLTPEKLQTVIDNYIYTQRKPLRDNIVDMLEVKPKVLERKKITERIIDKIVDFVETFVNGVAG
ncbi:MAG: type I restriction endonuclease subunit R [Candidatus Margulisiibacteriota bacterium]|nr:MAG: type I restriction endonuclease subunit R [Candidatus Margulisiibacteriota bacterium]